MKKTKKLIILLVVLAVCVAAMVIVPKAIQKTEEEEESVSTVIFSASDGTIGTIAWTYDGNEMKFAYADGTWTYEEDADFPLDQSYLTSMASALTEVEASKTIDDPEDLADYGLAEPEVSVTVTVSNTSETSADAASSENSADAASESDNTGGSDDGAAFVTVTLSFGNETAVSGETYCSTGDGKVYLVDSSLREKFEYALLDIVEYENIPDMDDATAVQLEFADGTLYIGNTEETTGESSDETTEEEADESTEEAADETTEEAADETTEEAADETTEEATDETTAEILEAASGIEWDACVNYNASEEKLSAYGFDNCITVTVYYTIETEVENGETDTDGNSVTETVYNTAVFTYEIAMDSDGNCYAKLPDSGMIYAIDDSLYETLVSVKEADTETQTEAQTETQTEDAAEGENETSQTAENADSETSAESIADQEAETSADSAA